MAELEQTLARIGTSSDPLRQEARRLIDGGNVAGGQAKLNAALDADEKAIAEVERVAAERRMAAAQSARDLAVLVEGTDVIRRWVTIGAPSASIPPILFGTITAGPPGSPVIRLRPRRRLSKRR